MAGSVGTLEEGGSSKKRETGGEQHPHAQVGTEASLGHMAMTYTSPSSFHAMD